jgi:hypothetical protein
MMKVLKVIPVAALVAITSTDSAFAADPPKDVDGDQKPPVLGIDAVRP